MFSTARLTAANLTSHASNLPHYRSLLGSLKVPRRAQTARLLDTLRRNAASLYGRKYGFAGIRSAREYQERVPIVSYEALTSHIEDVKAGRPNVLSSEPVLRFEKTSGSSSAAKYIPYTRSLLREFHRAIDAWTFNLYWHRPALRSTSAYWAISPIAQVPEVTRGGIQVGVADDTDYFGPLTRILLRQLFAVPPAVGKISDVESWQYITLRFLLDNERLGVVSVWSPTFLTLLLGALDSQRERLAEDIVARALNPPKPLPRELQSLLESTLVMGGRRDRAVVDALKRPGPLNLRALWPFLHLVSCWASGPSAFYVPAIQSQLPAVEIQGKGLLATEGIVSFPLVGQQGSVVAVRSHFYEFLEEGGNGTPLLVDELDLGRTYSVLMTTGGGLYRYNLGDLVNVVGYVEKTPLVEFVGRRGDVSDVCGEKLNGAWVQVLAESVFQEFGISYQFVLIAPEAGPQPCYALFLELVGPMTRDVLLKAAEALEGKLIDNPHYRHCRELGQLGPLRPFLISSDGLHDFVVCSEQVGQRLGTIKPVLLDRRLGWSGRLKGTWIM